MNDIRRKKLESGIRREVSGLIAQGKLKQETGFVSVTRINLAPDFSSCIVFISLFGSDDENKTTLRSLINARHFIQSTVSRKLRLRNTPRFDFQEDQSIKEGDRILGIIEKEKNP